MSTNYYWHAPWWSKLIHPKRSSRIHIGKRSGGWVFALHVDESLGLNDLSDWAELWSTFGSNIYNEYQDRITMCEMLDIIYQYDVWCNWNDVPSGYLDWDEFHQINSSEFGPNGLLRCRLSNDHCVRHGNIWDCIVGEFV